MYFDRYEVTRFFSIGKKSDVEVALVLKGVAMIHFDAFKTATHEPGRCVSLLMKNF